LHSTVATNESMTGNSYTEYFDILFQSCARKNYGNPSIFVKVTAKILWHLIMSLMWTRCRKYFTNSRDCYRT